MSKLIRGTRTPSMLCTHDIVRVEGIAFQRMFTKQLAVKAIYTNNNLVNHQIMDYD